MAEVKRFLLFIFLIFAMLHSTQCIDPNGATNGAFSCGAMMNNSNMDIDYEDGAYNLDTLSIPVTIAKNIDGADATSGILAEITAGAHLKKHRKFRKTTTMGYEIEPADENNYNGLYASTGIVGILRWYRIGRTAGKALILNTDGQTIDIITSRASDNQFSMPITKDMVGNVYAIVITGTDVIRDDIPVSAPIFVKINEPVGPLSYTASFFITGVGWLDDSDLISFSETTDDADILERPMGFIDIDGVSSVIYSVEYPNGDNALWSTPVQGGYPEFFADMNAPIDAIISTQDEAFILDELHDFYYVDTDGPFEIPIYTKHQHPIFKVDPNQEYIIYTTQGTNPTTGHSTIKFVLYIIDTDEHIPFELADCPMDFKTMQLDWVNNFSFIFAAHALNDDYLLVKVDLEDVIDGLTEDAEWKTLKQVDTYLDRPVASGENFYYLRGNPRTGKIVLAEYNVPKETSQDIVDDYSIENFQISYDKESYIVFQTRYNAEEQIPPIVGTYNRETGETIYHGIGHAPFTSNSDLEIVAYRYRVGPGSGSHVGILNLGNSIIATSDELSLYPDYVQVGSGHSLTFEVRGGIFPYTFSILSGRGEINENTGRFRASKYAGKTVIQVEDGDGNTATANVIVAAPGDLDTNFNNTGIKLLNPYKGTAAASVISNDGYLITAGTTNQGDIFVTRLNSSGEYDVHFNEDGYKTVGMNAYASARDVMVDKNGTIYAVGYTSDNAGHEDFSFIAVDVFGDLNDNFNNSGKQQTDFGFGDDRANAIGMLSNGQFLVAGFGMGPDGGFDYALAKYNTNGKFDLTFGNSGRMLINIAGGNAEDKATSMFITADDKILLAGMSIIGGVERISLIRLLENGNPDNSFGIGGKVITTLGPRRFFASDVKVIEGRIFVTGTTIHPDTAKKQIFVAKYKLDGTLDTSFSGDGIAIESSPNPVHDAQGFSIASSGSSGKVIVGGITGVGINPNYLTLVRFRSNGSLDRTFDKDGFRIYHQGNVAKDEIKDVYTDSSGRTISTGKMYDETAHDKRPMIMRTWY